MGGDNSSSLLSTGLADESATNLASFEAIDEENLSDNVAWEQAADPMSTTSWAGATETLPTACTDTGVQLQTSNEMSADDGVVIEGSYSAAAAYWVGETPEADLYAQTEAASWVPVSHPETNDIYYWNPQTNE